MTPEILLKEMIELYEYLGIEDSDSGEDKDHAVVERSRLAVESAEKAKKKIYISGPYTKGDVVINVRNAVLASDLLLSEGFIPFCPHTTHLWHTIAPRPWQDWMNYDLEWIGTCGYMLRLPGESKGGDMEVARAIELGIPVYYSIEELLKNVKP